MSVETETKRLLAKSKESFALAVELYNRPTLKHHAEICSIFLCNAWELMLKAHILREHGLEAIYYPDEKDRSLSLTDCLKKVFTNEKSPLRINMRELIKFRNTSTHFITDEYEIFYGPFLQASVSNYADKLLELHDESVSDLIPENHLSLSIRRGTVDPEVIRARYEPQVAEKLLQQSQSVAISAGENGSTEVAALYETNFRLVKKEKDADLNIYVDSSAKSGVAIIKDIKDSASYYPFTMNGCITEINKRLQKQGVEFQYKGRPQRGINRYQFGLFAKVYNMKGDQRYTYDRKASNEANSLWVYSKHAIDFIAERIKKDPQNCIDTLKRKNDENNEK